jgi:hypothetical protein
LPPSTRPDWLCDALAHCGIPHLRHG